MNTGPACISRFRCRPRDVQSMEHEDKALGAVTAMCGVTGTRRLRRCLAEAQTFGDCTTRQLVTYSSGVTGSLTRSRTASVDEE